MIAPSKEAALLAVERLLSPDDSLLNAIWHEMPSEYDIGVENDDALRQFLAALVHAVLPK